MSMNPKTPTDLWPTMTQSAMMSTMQALSSPSTYQSQTVRLAQSSIKELAEAIADELTKRSARTSLSVDSADIRRWCPELL